jgi:hemoglobin/transferrin/lactoferrin receptor protein
MTKSHTLSVFSSFLIVAMASPLLAQDPPPTQPTPTVNEAVDEAVTRLDRIFVTPLREAAQLLDIPHAAHVVSGAKLESARTITDALRAMPGVAVQRTSYGQSSPYVRGLTGYHTLWMVDGLRLNNSVWRSGPNEYSGTIDSLSLDRMEVVLGPGSVLFGSDAVGGVLNVIPRSRNPREASPTEIRTLSRYSTAEASITGRGEVSGSTGKVGFVVGTSLAHFGDLDQGGGGRQPLTGYRTGFGDAHIQWALDDQWTLKLLTQTADLDSVDRTHRTASAVPYHGTTLGSDRLLENDYDRDLAALTLSGTGLGGLFDSLEFRVAMQTLDLKQQRVRSTGARELQGFDVDTLGFVAQGTIDAAIGELVVGLDWWHDNVDSWRDNYNSSGVFTSSSIQGPVGDDAKSDLAGLFAQDRLELGTGWSALLGVRATWASLSADRVANTSVSPNALMSVDDDFASVVSSARINREFNTNCNAWAGVSQSFRAPTLSDLTAFDVARTNEVEVPVPGLDPEKFLSFEVGVHVDEDSWQGTLALWHTRGDDLIIRRPTTQLIGGNVVVTKSNAGEGFLQGVDLAVSKDLSSNCMLFGTCTITDGSMLDYATSSTTPIFAAPTRLTPIQGMVGLRWELEDGRFTITPSIQMVAHQSRLSPSDVRDTQRIPPGGSPGYTILGVDARWKVNASTDAWLSLANIGDVEYRVHGSGVQEAGFNLVMGVDVRF